MSKYLKSRELCPVHRSYFCTPCHKEKKSKVSLSWGNRRSGTSLTNSPAAPPKFRPRPAVEYIPDSHHENGVREICNDRELSRRKLIKAEEQRNDKGEVICLLCDEAIQSAPEMALCHKQSKGMGGGWRDDSLENLFVGHHRCNGQQGSMSLEMFLARKKSA